MPARRLQTLFETFLKLHAETRAMGEHAIAYHALSSALHAAESLGSEAACERVERLAREHGGWIDEHDPANRLSSDSAKSRGHESIFKQLAATAQSARLRMQVQKQQGRPKAPLAKPKKGRATRARR